MKLPPSTCPNCNSPQRFTPRKRVEGELITRYGVCLMCKEEVVFSERTREQERQIRRRNQAIRRHR